MLTSLLGHFVIMLTRVDHLLIKVSMRTACRKVKTVSQMGEKERAVVSLNKERKEGLYIYPVHIVNAVGGQQVGKRLTPFSSPTVISISMWIYTCAHIRGECTVRAPRLAGIYGRVGPVY